VLVKFIVSDILIRGVSLILQCQTLYFNLKCRIFYFKFSLTLICTIRVHPNYAYANKKWYNNYSTIIKNDLNQKKKIDLVWIKNSIDLEFFSHPGPTTQKPHVRWAGKSKKWDRDRDRDQFFMLVRKKKINPGYSSKYPKKGETM
jgi:hypothetical protein